MKTGKNDPRCGIPCETLVCGKNASERRCAILVHSASWNQTEFLEVHSGVYPLAQNQYINNSPGIFSCIRPGVNTCAACICTEIYSPNIFLCIGPRHVRIQALYQYRGQGQSANTCFKNNSSKIFSCIRTSANTGPTCIREKNNSSRIFSCMYRFCAGGYVFRVPSIALRQSWNSSLSLNLGTRVLACLLA